MRSYRATTTKHCRRQLQLFVVLPLLTLSSSSSSSTQPQPQHQSSPIQKEQQQLRVRQQRQLQRNNNNNNNNNDNNIRPREKDVKTFTHYCTTQALLDADISRNKFISRAEYVNLLLDVAPSTSSSSSSNNNDCPIIDHWLNENSILQETFNQLSCLCKEFGGLEGENNCCLQQVGVPMLASFAIPNSFYPDDYTVEACALIDQVINEVCPVAITIDDTTSTPSPTTAWTPPLVDLPMVTAAPSALAPALPTSSPSSTMTDEQTSGGDIVEVIIQDGELVTVEEHTNTETGEEEIEFSTTTSQQQQQQHLSNDDGGEGAVVNQEEYLEEQEEPAVVVTTTVVSEEEQGQDEDKPVVGIPLAQDGGWDGEDSILPTSTSNSAAEATTPPLQERKPPMGIVLAALMAITFAMCLGIFAFWGRRRRLFAAASQCDVSKQDPTDSSMIGGDPSDTGDNVTIIVNDNNVITPTRSNVGGRGNNHTTWSSDDEASSSTEGDDDYNSASLSDSERPRRIRGGSGGMNNLDGRVNSSSRNVVVRAEFQDDLSIWGRRKRRKQDRKQRREERKRISLEHSTLQYGSSMTNILDTLEFDLSTAMETPTACNTTTTTTSGAAATTTGCVGRVLTPVAVADETVESGCFGAEVVLCQPEESTKSSSVAAANNTPRTPKNLNHDIDIFDDTSETSSYDGSPQPNAPLPLETSIENWLEQVQQGSIIDGEMTSTTDHSQLLDDHSQHSLVSMASRMSRKSLTSTTSTSSSTTRPRPPPRGVSISPTKRIMSLPPLPVPNHGGDFANKFFSNNKARSFSPRKQAGMLKQQQPLNLSASFSPKAISKTRGGGGGGYYSAPSSPPPSQSYNIMGSSASFSPTPAAPLSHSVPTSPSAPSSSPRQLQPRRFMMVESSPSKHYQQQQLQAESAISSLLQLDLPVEHTHRPLKPAPTRLSPDSQEFYDSVLGLEPSLEEEEERRMLGMNGFAFERARRSTERYLV